MKKNAFTLTELIATIVILGVVTLIAVPSYKAIVSKSREKLYQSYEAKMKDAAGAFVANCINKNICDDNKNISYYERNSAGIKLTDLVTYDYIENLKNPEKSGSVCQGYVNIQTVGNTGEYNYKACLQCEDAYETSGCTFD